MRLIDRKLSFFIDFIQILFGVFFGLLLILVDMPVYWTVIISVLMCIDAIISIVRLFMFFVKIKKGCADEKEIKD